MERQRSILARILAVTAAGILTGGVLAGCGSTSADATTTGSPATAASTAAAGSTASTAATGAAPATTQAGPAPATTSAATGTRTTSFRTDVGAITFTLPAGYTAQVATGDVRGGTNIGVMNADGNQMLTFTSRPASNPGDPQPSPGTPGTWTDFATRSIDLPTAPTGEPGAGEGKPVVRFSGIDTGSHVYAGLGISSHPKPAGEATTGFIDQTVSSIPVDNKAAPARTATYAFGTTDLISTGDASHGLANDFDTVEQARAYMRTAEYQQLWTIVSSLKVDQTGVPATS